jgi:hypothetical protein
VSWSNLRVIMELPGYQLENFTEKLILPFQVVNEIVNEVAFVESALLALRDFRLIFFDALYQIFA